MRKTYNNSIFAIAFCLLGFNVVKAQAPYCDPAMTAQSGNCTTYNMSINAVQILQGTTVLYNRAHTTTNGGCNAATGQYFLISSSSLFTLKAGGTYTFGFTTGPTYAVGVGVWIDLNADNDFADAGEWLSNGWCTPYLTAGSSTLQNFTLKVPSAITPGVTRLRIRSNYNACTANDNGCTTYNYGEAEDYTITLASDPDDAGITNIAIPLCSPALVATVSNLGNNDINPVKVGWSVNGIKQRDTTLTTTLAKSGGSKNVTLAPDYNFVDGSTYTVKVYTFNPNNVSDVDKKNDTAKLVFKYVGPAKNPTVTSITKCGPGKLTLSATPGNIADSIVWFNVATGGAGIARGKSFLSPTLFLGVNTFYAQAFKMGPSTSFANAMTPSTGYGSTYSGGFADITPNKGIVIDSFDVQMTANVPNATWNVYMRTGTYVGYQTSPTGWTKVCNNVTARVRLVGSYYRSYIQVPELPLNQGVTYGFYITSTPTVPCSPWCNAAGSITISNNDITVSEANISYGAEWANITTVMNMTWETFYRTMNCGSARMPLVVTVKPSPNGAAFIKSTPFQTTQPNTTGNIASPDIVAKGDKLTYEITPPKGYNNVDYGTTWVMSGFALRKKDGTPISTAFYSPTTPTPTGSANAKFTFAPDASLVDETIIMTMSLRDLGPYFCDSILTRYIFVAPRPVADFKFSSPVCHGDAVVFSNMSKLSSGYISNKWDFNTGNPADTSLNSDAVFTFPTFGTYNVKLTTTSVPYGYTDSKTYSVVVSEIPKIGFKVLNACLGDSVKFINSTTIGSGTMVYNWDFGNGSSSTKVNPGKKYPVAGGYKVTLTATSNGCSQTLTKNAQQFARPVAKFSVPLTLCDKTDILFTNGSTIPIGNMGYTWNFGDGIYSGYTNPTHSFATTGNKTVKLKVVSEFGCADSITKILAMAEAPVAQFTTGPVCNQSATSFMFTGTKPGGYLTTFLWDFEAEGTTSVESPTKLFSNIGKQMVTLTLTSNNGCSDVIKKEIDVKLQSKADFIVADVCEDDDVVFTNNSTVSAGNLLYTWRFGDGKNSGSQSPRHLYPIAGTSETFNVTLVAIVPGGCSDSISKQVTVNAKPKSDFNYKTSGRLVNFNAIEAGNTTYQWDFKDGATAATPTAQYHYLNYPSGKYVVCLSVFNAAGCFSQTCKEVTISGGIDKLSKLSGVNIYPNPNKGNFTVTVEDPRSDISIAVYNLLGDVVKVIETNPLKSVYSVDLNVANGIYLVKVTNGGLISSQKITINK